MITDTPILKFYILKCKGSQKSKYGIELIAFNSF